MTTVATLETSRIQTDTTNIQSDRAKPNQRALKDIPLDLTKTSLKTAGRIADGIEGVIDIPRNIGEFVARYATPIPMVGAVAQNTGLLVSGLTKFAVHCSTFGTLRWLSGIRRNLIVADVSRDAIGKRADLSSMTVAGFVSTIRDPGLRQQFSEYLELLRTKADPHKLLKVELSLGRNADFQELRALMGTAEEKQAISQARLSQIAEEVASRMIARIDEKFAGKGTITGLLPGSWSYLASQGEAGRANLVAQIKEQLLGAYLKERDG